MNNSPLSGSVGRKAGIVALALVAIGTVSRVAPLFDVGGRMLKQFPTEDGYLMLTIARNIAIGQGMSTANGFIPTNGTQPGFNFIEAGLFALAHGDKRTGVLLTQIVSIVIALLAAWVLFRLGRRVLRERSFGADAAAIAAAAWFASPNIVPHSMNCLETGLYALMILLVLLGWHRLFERTDAQATRRIGGAIGMGVLLGAMLWARIDGVFLLAATCTAHVALSLRRGGPIVRARLAEAVVMGAVAVACFSPWLIGNKLHFGSFMPISGTAQAYGAKVGENAIAVPAVLAEYASILLPIPSSIEEKPLVVLACVVGLGVYVFLLLRAARSFHRGEIAFVTIALVMSALFVVYYGVLFGAAYFMARYLSPLSAPLALATTVGAFAAFRRFGGAARIGWAPLPVAALVVLLVAGTNLRLYANGSSHMHFQVVEWTAKNVAEQKWMGAVQTGTLGFFHDRTINLDGKVNPEALKHLIARTIPDYVADGRFGPERATIDYIADWVTISKWIDYAPLKRCFRLIVEDHDHNLAVLERTTAP